MIRGSANARVESGQKLRVHHGYQYVRQGENPIKYVHIMMAEKALCKPLPPMAVVHHVDLNKLHNVNENLVICPDQAYHSIIHCRTAAYDNCGNASFRRCTFCKKYDDPENMYCYNKYSFYHVECKKEVDAKRWKNNALKRTLAAVSTSASLKQLPALTPRQELLPESQADAAPEPYQE